MRNLILSGGVAHDYSRTSRILADMLMEVGIDSEIHENFLAVENGSLLEFDMLTLNCVRWTCSQPQVHPSWPEKWHFELSSAAREGFSAFLEQGKALLALHAAVICFDDWPEYRNILGGWWEWGSSAHTEIGEHPVHVRTARHPITDGMSDFIITDELYLHLNVIDSAEVLLDAEWEGKVYPVSWVHEYRGSRVCYISLGHGTEAFLNPSYQVLVQRSALWTLREI